MKMHEGPSIESTVQKLLNVEKIVDEIDQERIKPEDFKKEKYFTEDEIKQDLERCMKLQEIFDIQNKNLGDEKRAELDRGLAAEYTFRHAIEEHGWLAKDIKMIVTSQYDDYVRGIDSVAQINMGPDIFEHLGFAVDFAGSNDSLGKKLTRMFDEVDNGSTASVKYFDSEKTGKIKNFKVPRIVIGAGHETLNRLAEYSSEIMNGTSMSDEAKKGIAQDSFRYVMFGEIEAQLSVCVNRLKKVVEKAVKEKRNDIEKRAVSSLKIYEKSLGTVQELAEKAKIDIETIRKHVKGDSFMLEMGRALSALSLTSIQFRE